MGCVDVPEVCQKAAAVGVHLSVWHGSVGRPIGWFPHAPWCLLNPIFVYYMCIPSFKYITCVPQFLNVSRARMAHSSIMSALTLVPIETETKREWPRQSKMLRVALLNGLAEFRPTFCQLIGLQARQFGRGLLPLPTPLNLHPTPRPRVIQHEQLLGHSSLAFLFEYGLEDVAKNQSAAPQAGRLPPTLPPVMSVMGTAGPVHSSPLLLHVHQIDLWLASGNAQAHGD